MIVSYKGKTPDVEQAAFIAENATITGDVVLGKDSSVWYSAVIRGDGARITIGDESNIQDGCVLHSDEFLPLTVGKSVTVGHKAILHSCTVGDCSLIGMGAIVLDCAVIGKNCIVGAGALVTGGKVFEDGMLILGSPAKAVRKLTGDELSRCKVPADHYVQQSKEYAK